MELSKKQQELIDRVAKENGFCDYTVSLSPGSNKGDNFSGLISSITIKQGSNTLDLILKSAHTSEALRKAVPIHDAYEREVYLYENIFKIFKKFQVKYNIQDSFTCTPKAYQYSSEDNHEYIVMENLKTQGYHLWNKKSPMNPGHIKAVLIEYAKFHAVSLAMKDKCPEKYSAMTAKIYGNVFEANPDLHNKEKLQKLISVGMSGGYEAVADDLDLIQRIKNVEKQIINIFTTDLNDEKYKLVVNHGDCWCNNFLFKYDDLETIEKPSSLRILDWQISSVSTPAYDISYFLLANSSKEVFDDYKTYLKLYHDTLSSQLLNFGCDPQKNFPYALLEDHLRTFFPFGLYMSLMIIKVMVSESEEAPNLDEEGGDIVNFINFSVKNMDEYKRRVKTIILFLRDNGYI